MKTIASVPASFKTFKKAVPKAVSVPRQDQMVATAPLVPDTLTPLVYRPALDDVDLVAWAGEHRAGIERALGRHGALLFRGFELPAVADFERFAQSVCPQLYGEYGDLPSEDEGERVYRSTPYPPDKTILFHNESSHMHRWPRKQMFFCVTVAAERGETPIVDCREVYRQLDPALREAFERKGLLYVRNFVDHLDVSWQAFFKTSDRAAVEAYCRRSGFEHQWLDGDGLRIRQRAPAVIRHPESGEKSFFNQVQLHHVSFLDPDLRASLESMYDADAMPRNVYFGDGTPIDDAAMADIEQLYWRLAVQFPWQKGDVLVVDNMLIAHARNPFVGERKMVVAMGEMVDQQAVA